MIVGVDCSNLRAGSALTYMSSLLGAARPEAHGIDGFVVWGGAALLEALPERAWIARCHDPALERSVVHRIHWQRTRLARQARERCQVLWVPGGTAAPGFRPLVTMFHNMLPFDLREARRYGLSYMTLRLLLLRLAHLRTFRRADGLIFLTRYGRDVVLRKAALTGRSTIVPNGVEGRFRMPPRPQRAVADVTHERPFRFLYVSIVDVYKHPWDVAEAVARLRGTGLPVSVDFVGPAYPPAGKRLLRTLDRLDPARSFLRYLGPAAHARISELYQSADAFVFASSCENMPLILLEAMAAGLPIACSERAPMPEVLGEAGVFFDPDDVASIAEALRTLILDPQLRARLADAAYHASEAFTWERSARETLAFIAEVARS